MRPFIPPIPDGLKKSIKGSTLAVSLAFWGLAISGGWPALGIMTAAILSHAIVNRGVAALIKRADKSPITRSVVPEPLCNWKLQQAYDSAARRTFGRSGLLLQAFNSPLIEASYHGDNTTRLSRGALTRLNQDSVVALALHEHAHATRPRVLDKPALRSNLAGLRGAAIPLVAGIGALGASPLAMLCAGAAILTAAYGLTVAFNTSARKEELACDYAAAYGLGTAYPMLRALRSMELDRKAIQKKYPIFSVLSADLPYCAEHPSNGKRRMALQMAQKAFRREGIRPEKAVPT